jgi:cell division protein FtsN
MLRWMVVALLVVNAALFAWYRYSDAVVTAEPQPAHLFPQGDALHVIAASPVQSGAVSKEAMRSEAVARPKAEPICGMFGAFPELISARQVRDRLQSLGLSAKIIGITVPLRTDYWVHLGPYASRETALAKLKELQQAGVDSFLINEGDLANGISLGIFRQKHSAESLLAKRLSEGFQASIKEVPRESEELWVVFDGQDLAESVRTQLLAVAPGIEYRRNLCGGIVSKSSFE